MIYCSWKASAQELSLWGLCTNIYIAPLSVHASRFWFSFGFSLSINIARDWEFITSPFFQVVAARSAKTSRGWTDERRRFRRTNNERLRGAGGCDDCVLCSDNRQTSGTCLKLKLSPIIL